MKLHGHLTYEQEPRPYNQVGFIPLYKNCYFELGTIKCPVKAIKRTIQKNKLVRLTFWTYLDGRLYRGQCIGDSQSASIVACKYINI